MINMDQQEEYWVGLRLKPNLYKKLEIVAKARKRKIATMVKIILEDYLK